MSTYTYLEFQTTFPELFTAPPIIIPITFSEYEALSATLELETMDFCDLICIPTKLKDSLAITEVKVKQLANALYLAHILSTQSPNYVAFQPDGLKRVESLDNKLEWNMKPLDSKYQLSLTTYGQRLLELLEKYSCERIRKDEKDQLTTVHEIAGIGASVDNDCCDNDYFGVTFLW